MAERRWFQSVGRWAAGFVLPALGLAAIVVGCATRAPKSTPTTANAMRVLRDNCFACHDEDKRKGALVLSTARGLEAGGDGGPVVVPGETNRSRLIDVLAPESDPHMPPKKQLAARQIQVLRDWIAGGAVWDRLALEQATRPREVRLEALPEGYQPVLALALSPDAGRLAVGRGGQVTVYDVSATNHPVLVESERRHDTVSALAWSPDGVWLAVGGFRELGVLDAQSLDVRWHGGSNFVGRVTALGFTPHGGALVVADSGVAESGWIRVYSTESGMELGSWQAHQDSINALSLSRDGGRLATGGNDNLVRVWELVSGVEIARYEGHLGAVNGVAFNAEGTELLSVGADKQLKVWDVATREAVVTIGGGRETLTAAAWSGDGKTVVVGDAGGRLERFQEFKRHSGAQSSETAQRRSLGNWGECLQMVSVNGDASVIAAGGQDGLVRVVDREGKLLAQLGPTPRSGSGAGAVDGEDLEVSSQEDAGTLREATEAVPSFVRDVLPVLSKAGCNAGSCHAKADGQNGFKLSVFSYDPRADYAEIVKDGRGRRVFPSAAAESLLLLKPTLALDHGGGQRIEPGSEAHELLMRWIRGGMPYQQPNEPALAEIAIEPRQGSYRPATRVQLRVTARYADGSTRDVTELSGFASQDESLATVEDGGLVRAGEGQGEGVVVGRYMGMVDAARISIPPERILSDERYRDLRVANFIDERAYAQFRKLGLLPSARCSDAEFLRRSTLDTVGRLPTVDETRAFLADSAPDKRSQWIEHLLREPGYADFWANKWADLLRPNPDRVGVKSVYVLDQWLRASFRENLPYDQFVRSILTVEGSNHREGPAVVYRDRREPADRTTMFSQLFLGVRLECARCHHHPNEKWSQDDFYQLAAYFGPVKQKGAGLSPPISAGREAFYFAPGGEVRHPVTEEVMNPRPPDGPASRSEAGEDPRLALANWLTDSANPFFARSAVNRVWAALFGRGLVEPVDDFRVSNPSVNESLLDALATDFAGHGYDLKQLIRTILASELYQLSSTPNAFNLADTRQHSRSYRRRLPAEVLLDAVSDVTGVPDEFEGCPPGTRAIQTWSFKINSHFLDAFGRPNASTDAPCERDARPSVVQALHLMNSPSIQSKLGDARGRVRRLTESGMTPEEIVSELYLAAYSRAPSAEELAQAVAVFQREGADRQGATEDVLWALLNSAEFVFNH